MKSYLLVSSYNFINADNQITFLTNLKFYYKDHLTYWLSSEVHTNYNGLQVLQTQTSG